MSARVLPLASRITVAAGPRYTDFVTQWPSAFTAAASFDKDLILERARRIGQEFRGKGINVALAPVSVTVVWKSLSLGHWWAAGQIVSAEAYHERADAKPLCRPELGRWVEHGGKTDLSLLA